MLNSLRKKRIWVKIYFVNGFQTKGVIESFDRYTIIIKNGTQQSLLYKSAISTLIPFEYVEIEGAVDDTVHPRT